ncbi:MAG TPA: rhodanese-like domain-containing protein [Steroidobacteraceae bacterium]|nr:rhodanese-like domain-containing protein [Steroidobacteraceae bacterium]
MVAEITPREFLARRARGETILLLDVREPWEIALAPVPCDHLRIPLGEIAARIQELDAAQPTAVICHAGARSLQVAHFLERCRFQCVFNLTGGIDAWSVDADPSVPRY